MGRINFHVTFTSSGVDPKPVYPEITSVVINVTPGLKEGEENVKANSQVATVRVEGGTAPYSYELINGEDKFEIFNGSITCKEDLTADNYSVEVKVTDSNSKTSNASTTIIVAEADPIPEINNVTLQLVDNLKEGEENVEVGAVIGTFNTSGGTEPFTYELLSETDKFEVDNDSLKVKDNPLTEGSYDITFKVTDSKQKEKEGSAQVVVESKEAVVIPITVAVPSNDKDLLGKHANELQDNVSIVEDGKVTGTLKYITDYTKFSPKTPDEQKGNYLALYFEQATQEGITIEIQVQGSSKKTKLDNDGLYVCRMTEAGRKPLTVTLTKTDGGIGNKTLNVSELVLEKPDPEIDSVDLTFKNGTGTFDDKIETGTKLGTFSAVGGTEPYTFSVTGDETALEKVEVSEKELRSKAEITEGFTVQYKVADSKEKEKTGEKTITVTPRTITVKEPTEEVYGKAVSDLQMNVTFAEDNVKGYLKHVNDYDGFEEGASGNFLALEVEEAKNGQEIQFELSDPESKGTGTLNTEDSLLVCKIHSTDQTITLKNGKTTKVLKLNELVLLNQANEVVTVLDQEHGMGNKTVKDIQTDAKISEEGKITGTLQYVEGLELSGGRKQADGNYLCLHVDKTKLPKGTIKHGINNMNELGEDYDDVLLSVTNESKQKPYKISVNDKILFEYDLKELTLNNKVE